MKRKLTYKMCLTRSIKMCLTRRYLRFTAKDHRILKLLILEVYHPVPVLFLQKRAHFSHENCRKGELSFHKGKVFHVMDTLHSGTLGSWLAYRLGRSGRDMQRGVIPNSARASDLAQQTSSAPAKKEDGSFFKRRARRSRSLCKDYWEDFVLAGFIRPVVLFGPVSDIV